MAQNKLVVDVHVPSEYNRGVFGEILRKIQQFVNLLPQYKSGTFTMANANSKTVSDTSVLSTSTILLMPTNAAAGTLMAGATSLYISARTSGASFAVSTADTNAAAGTETFQYLIIN